MNPCDSKKFHIHDRTPEQLFDFLLGPIRWQVISIALELNVFDLLVEFNTAKDISEKLSLQLQQTTVFLDSLCALELVTKNQQTYRIEPSAKPYLLSNSEHSMRDMLLHLSTIKHTDNQTAINTLRTGNSDHISATLRNKDFWKKSQNCLYSFHNSITNRSALSLITNLPEWPNINHILDLGAGSESLSLALLNENPNIKITLFDLPACATPLKQKLKNEPRINVIEGDFNANEIGRGYDLVWASMSLYYATSLNRLFSKIKNSLNHNGVLLSFHEALKQERTQPEAHVTSRFLPAISGNNLSFDDEQLAHELAKSGFHSVESHYVDMPIGEMRLDIGRLS